MSNTYDCNLDEAKMWYLTKSARKEKLKIAAQLTRKRQEHGELDRRLATASGLDKVLLENNKRHLALETAELWREIAHLT